jgi:putative phosphoribosyl transferase
LLRQLNLPEDAIGIQTKKTIDVIKKRDQLFRREQPYPMLTDKTVIIADDGLASGYTMLAGVRFIRTKAPQKVIVAVPTGSKRTIDRLLPETDELICLNVRSRLPFAVADAYRNWYDLTDKEVLDILKRYSQKLHE